MSRDTRPPDDREIPPAELRVLARARSQARREHRFEEADRIREEIEAQGWNVVDRGAEARLVRAHPLDIVDDDGVTRYGWSGAVPEATGGTPDGGTPDGGTPDGGTPDGAAFTVILRALPKVEATDSLVARLTGGGTHPGHLLVVAADGSPDPSLPGVEVIRLRGEAGPGTLLAVALRRVASGAIVVGERWPADATPQDLDALVGRLDDPTVAVTGLVGSRSDDLRQFSPGGTADTPVEAVGWAGLTFRATEGRARGPVDEGFSDPELLAAWWSLGLRDSLDDAPTDAPSADGVPAPRHAIAIRSTEHASDDPASPDDKATRRDRYRLIDRFAGRQDLVVR